MKRVDVTGEVCPRPALIVRRELAELEPGERLLVEGDYAPAERNLRRSCTRRGFDVTGLEETAAGEDGPGEAAAGGDGTFGLVITATEDASIPGEQRG